jgi:RHS repeat-associated protein
MYQPTLGRFLSRDPLGEGGVDVLYDNNEFGDWLTEMRNTYGYVSNNPVRYVDPTGLLSIDVPLGLTPETGVGSNDVYVCFREIRAETLGEHVARACDCPHTDIYSEHDGEIRHGGLGGIPKGMGGTFPPAGYTCRKMERYVPPTFGEQFRDLVLGRIDFNSDVLEHGIGKGKSCAAATDREIVDCIRSFPKPLTTPGLLANCQTDVQNALEACCLTGFKSTNTILRESFDPRGCPLSTSTMPGNKL